MIYATLNGTELLAKAPISWTLAYGTTPQVTSIEVPDDEVQRVLDRARIQFSGQVRTRERGGFSESGPVTLELRDTDKPERDVIVQGLYITSVGPADRLNSKLVQLADRRWLAPRTVVRRLYNIRKDSGDRRLIGADGNTPEQLGQTVTDYAFRAPTLRGEGEPWTPYAVLYDVLAEVFGEGGFKIGRLPDWRDDVESLELWDRGDEALSRLQSLLPGLEFFVDYDGKVTTANLYDEDEHKLVEQIDAAGVEAGDLVLAQRHPVIPQGFQVQFLARTELRLDYVEGVTAQGTVSRLREPLELQNVIINPVLRLTLPDGREANMGEAIEVSTWLSAINTLKAEDGVSGPEITQEQIRAHWMAGWAGWTIPYVRSQGAANGALLQKWTAIFAALRSHWRRTFRIRPEWVDKVYGLKASRVAIIDAENGSRAKATVHAQYLVRISQLAFNTDYKVTNLIVDDYADNLQESQVSPFDVIVLNPDAGLIQLVPRTDEEGKAQSYVLGTVTASEIPSADIRDAAVIWGKAKLNSEFKVAVVLSAQRCSPPNEKSLHVEEVTLADAARRLGLSKTPDASGPLYELRSFEDEARFAWDDERSDEILEAYYAGAEFPAELQVNSEATKQLALAHAAAKLAEVLPRYVGTVRIPMRALVPAGSIGTVTHTISPAPGTTMTTTVTAAGKVSRPSTWSLLPEGLRRILRGQVDRSGGSQ